MSEILPLNCNSAAVRIRVAITDRRSTLITPNDPSNIKERKKELGEIAILLSKHWTTHEPFVERKNNKEASMIDDIRRCTITYLASKHGCTRANCCQHCTQIKRQIAFFLLICRHTEKKTERGVPRFSVSSGSIERGPTVSHRTHHPHTLRPVVNLFDGGDPRLRHY